MTYRLDGVEDAIHNSGLGEQFARIENVIRIKNLFYGALDAEVFRAEFQRDIGTLAAANAVFPGESSTQHQYGLEEFL